MRKSLILGVVGGIFALLVGIVLLALGNVNGQMYPPLGTDLSQLQMAGAIAIVAGLIGLVGAYMGKKIGGALMIIAGLLSIVGGAAAVLTLILLIAGGILALRET